MSRINFMLKNNSTKNAGHWVYVAYVIRNGRRIYPKRGRVLRFWVAD